VCVVALSGPALAQESDEAALAIADRTSSEATVRRACIESAEAAASATTYSDGTASRTGGRASFNMRCESSFASGWRGVLSDRFDQFWARAMPASSVNTLKEAYVSFRPGGSFLVDGGRINVRQGVALAYNPTDYFRSDAVRAVTSIDPETLRAERMGTLMGRVQTLWSSGSLTGIVAPRVAARPNDSAFNPDLGATNHRSRWLLIWSQRLAQDFQPQISVTGAEHESPQAGVDVTHLLNRATVAYLEWSGGRDDSAFRSRLSTGLTYTTSFKLSMTLEYEYDEAAPGKNEWAALRRGPIPAYARYREYRATAGELATRQNVFSYAHWDDVGIAHLGVSAFVRFDPYDHSRLVWGEARYHWEHAGIAVQWQHSAGQARSDFVSWPTHQSWVALVDYYF
jgi:hypothetical protein